MRLLATLPVVPSPVLLAVAQLMAQGRPDQVALIVAQKEAMATLKALDGVWRGDARTLLGIGQKHGAIQTREGDTDWPGAGAISRK